MDDAGHVTEFNRAAEQVFDYSRKDVLGQPMAPLRADGTEFPISLSVVPLTGPGVTGCLEIATSSVVLDAHFAARHPGAAPGEFVRLSVTDNGCGMDAETLANIFEPFFTTKARGHGTGLGMSTVYGIMQQNHGYIDIDSTVGVGTMFHDPLRGGAPEPGRAVATVGKDRCNG